MSPNAGKRICQLLTGGQVSKINDLRDSIFMTVAGVGIIVFLTGLLTIKTLESYEGDLITTGIFSIIRHPMYFGFILWVIGFPIYFGALFTLILSALFITNILIRLRVKLRRTRRIGLIPRCLHRSLSPELALGFIPFDSGDTWKRMN